MAKSQTALSVDSQATIAEITPEDQDEKHPDVAAEEASVVTTHSKTLKRQIANFTDVPHKAGSEVRVVSYNILSDFWDKHDDSSDEKHHWSNRAPIVKQLLSKMLPDFICLQELSPNQAFELAQYFSKEFISVFLSQTPSEIKPTGAIAYGNEVGNWIGKFAGTPLVGTFVNKSWRIAAELNEGVPVPQVGRFWLNEKPFDVPESQDRGDTDKGFGNMNTYRAVLWIKAENELGQVLYIFNSHYPLNGSSETRFKCAELEMRLIKEIAKDTHWVSTGDRNLIPLEQDNGLYNPETIYKELIRDGHDIRNSPKHCGISTTWFGFSYDKYKSDIEPKDMASHRVLDIMVSNKVAARSFHHPGAFDPHTHELIYLSDAGGIMARNEDRCCASDHALIGADFVFYPDPV